MNNDTREKSAFEMRVLRIDLTSGRIDQEQIDWATTRKYVGGTGIGTKFLYEEVGPNVGWSDPDNRLMVFSGPLGGTRVGGSGTISFVTKGPMTDMAGATQANGFFGAWLRSCGFDGIIIHGAAKKWTYLQIQDGKAELVDAEWLAGKDTWETEDAIKERLNGQSSVFSIGPAGENLVRFACVVGDRGHVAAHNGVGAVMGSKKLKAIAVKRGRTRVHVAEPDVLAAKVKPLFEDAKKNDMMSYQWGTTQLYMVLDKIGGLPVKNFTTNIFPGNEKMAGEYTRTHFKVKPAPCWACRMAHCRMVEVTEGPYKGFVGEEPEWEGMGAFGCLIDQADPGTAVMLSNMCDRLGMDVNETGWLLGWLMECYEKGFVNSSDLDGIELRWGDAEASLAMMKKFAHRQGCGSRFADGIKRSAEAMGGDALNCAIYTHKGASPRTHDHRAMWGELIDTCFSDTGTIQVWGGKLQPEKVGVQPPQDNFNAEQMVRLITGTSGRRQFDDCLGTCRFCLHDFQLTLDCLNAVTGWNTSIPEAMAVGRRIINQLRLFNFRHGMSREMERPSARYGSVPVDGPAVGKSIMPHWESIRRDYYTGMGWDSETGIPLPETLERLGLGTLTADLENIRKKLS